MDSLVERYMIRRDLKEVLEIECAVFGLEAWTENEFLKALRQRNCIGRVALIADRVVGYVVYEIHQSHLNIINLAISTPYQRKGLGASLVDTLKAKLHVNRRTSLTCTVRETNVEAQLFFKAMGLRVETILREPYTDTNVYEDGYVFAFRLPSEVYSNG